MNNIYTRAAYDVQVEAEKQMLYLANLAWELNPSDNLCIAGGLGLNCVANEYIRRNSKFKNIWIQPASDDSGLPLGATLYGLNEILHSSNRFRLNNANLGFSYDKVLVRHFLESLHIEFYEIEHKELAYLISEGKIVGWFIDSSEYGPRALGFRSILCDPRKREMKDIINMRVKHREIFRPFAPVVKQESAAHFFEIDTPSLTCY